MDFDVFEMNNIEDMEYDSAISSGGWLENDDCGSNCDSNCDDEESL